jgi:hypothetical protein
MVLKGMECCVETTSDSLNEGDTRAARLMQQHFRQRDTHNSSEAYGDSGAVTSDITKAVTKLGA